MPIETTLELIFPFQIMRYLFEHFLLFFVLVLFRHVYSNELTFELPDNARECFNEKLKVGSKYILEFQVRNSIDLIRGNGLI